MELFRPFLEGLYQTALPDDVRTLDDLLSIPPAERTAVTSVLAENNADLNKLKADRLTRLNNLNLPSVRTAKELYPIAPRDLLDFFLTENIYLLAKEVKEASRVKEIRAVDVRNYLRHTLGPAYAAMSHPTARAPEQVPPLADDDFLREVSEAINQRQFVVPVGGNHRGSTSSTRRSYTRVGISRDNIQGRAIAALCWAIAVDAVLLDEALRKDAHKVFAAAGFPATRSRASICTTRTVYPTIRVRQYFRITSATAGRSSRSPSTRSPTSRISPTPSISSAIFSLPFPTPSPPARSGSTSSTRFAGRSSSRPTPSL